MANPNLWQVHSFPELDMKELNNAASAFFDEGKGQPLSDFQRKTAEFYGGISLDVQGDRWLAPDIAAIEAIFDYVIPHPFYRVPNLTLLVIGVGPKRLIAEKASAAFKRGVRTIVLNDINPAFVDAAYETLIASDIGRSMRIIKAPGDAATLRLAERADLATATFFVSAEVCDIESAQALRVKREAFYHGIASNLVEGGCFIEDMPETVLPGFYATLKRLSSEILERHGVDELAGQLLLSHVPRPGGSLPYHVRCVPDNAWRDEELDVAGFELVGSWCDQADPCFDEAPLPVHRRRIKRIELLRKVPAREQRRLARSRFFFERLIQPTIAPPI